MKEFLNKKYSISLQYGNTEKTVLDMDNVDIYYGLSEKDKNEIILLLIERLKNGKKL
ncbi:MAG: hypothetical protein ACI4S3_07300 [Candidatus Gastranaerophilaceae bacterium]